MQPKLTFYFTNSAAALLAAMATVFFVGNLATGTLVQPHDPVLMVSMRILFWILGMAGLAVSLFCIFANNPQWKIALVLWLSLDLVIYGFAFQWSGTHGLGTYLGAVAEPFGLSTGTSGFILTAMFVYLLVGSSFLLGSSWWQKIREEAGGYLKIPCPSCGGKIKFPPADMGRQIPCPHCQVLLTLRKPEDRMKMVCVLCGGHVEFPAHALGQKIPCPHCAKTITLLQPT